MLFVLLNKRLPATPSCFSDGCDLSARLGLSIISIGFFNVQPILFKSTSASRTPNEEVDKIDVLLKSIVRFL
jgi:hypothetical protein